MITSSLLIHTDELSTAWIDRMLQNGISTIAIHPVGGWRAHLTLHELTERLKTEEYRALLDDAAEKGLHIEYEMHAMRYLLPASEFEAHPEWFRMTADGKRSSDRNCCASCDEVLDYIAENAAALAKKLYRNTNRYYFWLDDAKDAFCHCPKCAKLSASDQQMKILNHILKRLKEDNENAELAYLAYYDTMTPPETIMPEKGIFLEYAPYERDFHAPIEGNAQTGSIHALLRFFGTKGAKVLDYWYDNSYYSDYKKPPKAFTPDKPVIAADLAYYTALGFEELAGFACYLGADYEELYGEPDISDFGAFLKKRTGPPPASRRSACGAARSAPNGEV